MIILLLCQMVTQLIQPIIRLIMVTRLMMVEIQLILPIKETKLIPLIKETKLIPLIKETKLTQLMEAMNPIITQLIPTLIIQQIQVTIQIIQLIPLILLIILQEMTLFLQIHQMEHQGEYFNQLIMVKMPIRLIMNPHQSRQ